MPSFRAPSSQRWQCCDSTGPRGTAKETVTKKRHCVCVCLCVHKIMFVSWLSAVQAGMVRLACTNALVKLTDRHMYRSPIKILLLISMDSLPGHWLDDDFYTSHILPQSLTPCTHRTKCTKSEKCETCQYLCMRIHMLHIHPYSYCRIHCAPNAMWTLFKSSYKSHPLIAATLKQSKQCWIKYSEQLYNLATWNKTWRIFIVRACSA